MYEYLLILITETRIQIYFGVRFMLSFDSEQAKHRVLVIVYYFQ